ncbi:MAG: hypothetical protein GX121_01135 [Ignavibacteria bacterium]|jgi:hypothetical protein|nr:hypothetical protein [Ignavibacteria bacterium]
MCFFFNVKKNALFLFFFYFFFFNISLFSQEFEQEILEEYLEQEDEEDPVSKYFDELESYIENPLNLKKASIEQLSKLPEFSVNLSGKILHLVKKQNFNSIDEIADTLQLSLKQVRILKLFTTIEKVDKKKGKLYYRARNRINFKETKGFESDKFQGSPLYLYQRLSAEKNEYKIGFLTKKNPGEKSLNEFYSGYFSAEFENIELLLGDYTLRQGLGNILWSNYRNSKSSNVVSSALQYRNGFSPYRSSTDYKFFRGAALLYKLNVTEQSRFNISLSYSNIDRSATVDAALGIASSVYTAGYYRTDTEIQKKASLPETCFNGSLQFESKNFSLGASILNVNYKYSVESNAKNAFFGKDGNLSTLYSMFHLDNASFAFELSKDARNNLGAKAASILKIENLDLAFHYRNFSAEYRSPFGTIFGETYAPNNEEGLYSGAKWFVNQQFTLSSYIDIWRTHKETSTLPVPQKGIELFSEMDYFFDQDLEFIARFAYKNKTEQKTVQKEKKLFQKGIFIFRMELKYQIDKLTRIRLRNENRLINYEAVKGNETGVLLFCDIQRKFFSNFNAYARLSLHLTDSYDSAIWQYESDPLGYALSQALYGKGLRAYGGFKYEIFDFLALSAKFIAVKKANVEKLGSGLNETTGSSNQQLFIQLDMKF